MCHNNYLFLFLFNKRFYRISDSLNILRKVILRRLGIDSREINEHRGVTKLREARSAWLVESRSAGPTWDADEGRFGGHGKYQDSDEEIEA